MLNSSLLKLRSPCVTIQRFVGKHKFNWYDEGIQYPGFKYYPRRPDFKDPPYEATKLFRVQRIKPLKGVPFYEKKILEEFSLADGRLNQYAIIKNIPENNQRLWKVKHLIQIAPITYPDGFPKETDRTYLKENGELRILKQVGPVEEKMKLLESFKNTVERMDGDTLRRDSRKKWLTAWD